jgi:hypothetical protein
MKKIITILGILIVIVAAGIYLSNKDGKPVVSNDFAAVPTSSQLTNNLQKAGLEALSSEGTVMHIHQHIDITVNGQDLTIPADVGVAQTFISPLHTHDTSGVLHVESPAQKDFKLGQFFDEWGVTLSDTCIGTNCADDSHKLVVGVNGTPITNVHDYVLKSHDEIHIWYGPKDQTPELKKSYAFSADL